jgi:ferrous iron transport protein B
MKIALFGNPNTGKSTIFNLLTGMRQHVGNFPGITVDIKTGSFKSESKTFEIIDFPGTYSVYPHSKDEEVVYEVLKDPTHKNFPDKAVVIVDASNLERNLFLFTQIYDLNIPCVLVLNMADVAQRKGHKIKIQTIKETFPGIEVVEMNARVGLGLERLKVAIEKENSVSNTGQFLNKHSLKELEQTTAQEKEAEDRHQKLKSILPQLLEKVDIKKETKSYRIDRILVHPIWGYLIFAFILFTIFQFIYAFASYPMDWIDQNFSAFSNWIHQLLPAGLFSDLISQGIIPGIGGVVIFIPQIALLFFFLSLLEASGYLARVVFIMDRLMRPLGLNGKSVVPLLSSVACAIPGVMAARTINSWKERMITILVAPLMSCSARIPVYTLLITLVIPNKLIFGFIHLQGLVLFGLYALGLISALAVAFIFHVFIKTKEKSFLLLELPSYKIPRIQNIGMDVLEKVRIFVFEAGKVILAVSILLWGLATFGPSDRMVLAEKKLTETEQFQSLSKEEQDQQINSTKLQNSYIGILGKTIEPVIKPLGYDWKIGISLITSFAAREVFVGSMATIYSVHAEDDDTSSLIERMKSEKRLDGTLVYSLASGVSLMIFYVYAMQCMATLAVVKRETKSWKWPLFQIGFLGVLAYVGSLIAFNLLK